MTLSKVRFSEHTPSETTLEPGNPADRLLTPNPTETMDNTLKDLDSEMEALFDDLEYLTDEGIDIELETMSRECGVPLETVIDQYNSRCLWLSECVDEAQAERRQMGIC